MTEPLKIESMSDIVTAIKYRRCLICPSEYVWSKPVPAAVIINLSGVILMRLMARGLYVYFPNQNKHQNEPK